MKASWFFIFVLTMVAAERRRVSIVDVASSSHYATTQRYSQQMCNSHVLMVEFRLGVEGDGRMYGTVHSIQNSLLQDGDIFEYDIMWLDHDCNCGVEFEAGDYRLRDHAPLDSLGFSPHSERNANMSSVAFQRWYHRQWDIRDKALNIKIDRFVVSASGNPGKVVRALVRNVQVRTAIGTMRTKMIRPDDGTPFVTAIYPGTVTFHCEARSRVPYAAISMTTRHNHLNIDGVVTFVNVEAPATNTEWFMFDAHGGCIMQTVVVTLVHRKCEQAILFNASLVPIAEYGSVGVKGRFSLGSGLFRDLITNSVVQLHVDLFDVVTLVYQEALTL